MNCAGVVWGSECGQQKVFHPGIQSPAFYRIIIHSWWRWPLPQCFHIWDLEVWPGKKSPLKASPFFFGIIFFAFAAAESCSFKAKNVLEDEEIPAWKVEEKLGNQSYAPAWRLVWQIALFSSYEICCTTSTYPLYAFIDLLGLEKNNLVIFLWRVPSTHTHARH